MSEILKRIKEDLKNSMTIEIQIRKNPANGDFIVSGTGTLSASSSNTVAEETVTATGASSNDIVLITPTSDFPSKNNLGGMNGIYLDSVTTNTFVVKSMFPELKDDITFQFIVFEGA